DVAANRSEYWHNPIRLNKSEHIGRGDLILLTKPCLVFNEAKMRAAEVNVFEQEINAVVKDACIQQVYLMGKDHPRRSFLNGSAIHEVLVGPKSMSIGETPAFD